MAGIDPTTLARLLDAHAPFRPLPFVPEIRCWHTANEIPLWEALEATTGSEVPPPFFALAWPAGQALARLVLDGRVPVEGKRVVDVGCGSGAVALAAAMRGATVLAVDVDPLATTACAIAAERLGLRVEVACRDAFEAPDAVDADVILAADLVYHRSQLAAGAFALTRWRESRKVVLADGGRPHFEGLDLAGIGLAIVAEFEVPAERIVEGAESRRVRVFSS